MVVYVNKSSSSSPSAYERLFFEVLGFFLKISKLTGLIFTFSLFHFLRGQSERKLLPVLIDISFFESQLYPRL